MKKRYLKKQTLSWGTFSLENEFCSKIEFQSIELDELLRFNDFAFSLLSSTLEMFWFYKTIKRSNKHTLKISTFLSLL